MRGALANAPATAIVAVKDLENQFFPYWRPTKYRTDISDARLAAWSYVEGWERAIGDSFGRLFTDKYGSAWERGVRAILEACPPTYEAVRNWLHGDCDFAYNIACRVALDVVTINDRIIRRKRDL